MDYIEKALGEPVIRHPWSNVHKLPYFLIDEYQMEQATIGTQSCLLLTPRGELGAIGAIKKHLTRIQQDWSDPVVLELQELSRQRKQTLIAERIPFVVPEKQLYLPFMGTVLQEKHDGKKLLIAEKLQPSAQMLLFCFIYRNNMPLHLNEIPARFGFSKMTISRAADQLVATGLLAEHSEGVRRVLTSLLTPQDLFEQAKSYLRSPVRKKLYMDEALIGDSFFPAGLTALAQESMLNMPETSVYGTVKKPPPVPDTIQLLNNGSQCEVELWRYDPTVLSGENRVDVLSLALSLEHIRDERVELTVEELLERVWK